MTDHVFRIGPIRPPSEAASLLLQVTQGCTWNKCKFCGLYRDTKFKAFTVDSVKKDIDNMAMIAKQIRKHSRPEGGWDLEQMNREMALLSNEEQNCYYMMANWLINGGKHVFLQDGNTLALSGGRLTEVLSYLRTVFPQIERITSYGRAENLSKVTASEFAELKAAGLDRIHSGYESGSDHVLNLINKGVTAEQQMIAGRNIKAGGLELSVYFMPGIGGKALSQENARGMARVVSEAKPDFLRIRTAVVKRGTALYEDYRKGTFLLCSDDEKVHEIRTMITEAGQVPTIIASDHIVNLLQSVKGSLIKDREKMIGFIDAYLELPDEERKLFQLARRSGMVVSIKQMDRLDSTQRNQLLSIVSSIHDETQWNDRLNAMMEQFI